MPTGKPGPTTPRPTTKTDQAVHDENPTADESGMELDPVGVQADHGEFVPMPTEASDEPITTEAVTTGTWQRPSYIKVLWMDGQTDKFVLAADLSTRELQAQLEIGFILVLKPPEDRIDPHGAPTPLLIPISNIRWIELKT